MNGENAKSGVDLTPAWLEWYHFCSIDKCSQERINELCRAADHFYKRAVDILPQGQYSIVVPWKQKPEDYVSEASREYERRWCFHQMETQLLPNDTIEERRKFKQKTFSRASSPGHVTGYLLRDFFRSFVKMKQNRSYDLPSLGDDENGADAEEKQKHNLMKAAGVDLPHDAGEEHDQQLYESVAAEFWNTLNETERAALYCANNHICMSSPELLARVKLQKSQFCKIVYRLIPQYLKSAAENYQMTDKDDHLPLLIGFRPCYLQWQNSSELGSWIVSHTVIPRKDGMKVKFSEDEAEK